VECQQEPEYGCVLFVCVCVKYVCVCVWCDRVLEWVRVGLCSVCMEVEDECWKWRASV